MRNITFTLKFEVSDVKEDDFRKQCAKGELKDANNYHREKRH